MEPAPITSMFSPWAADVLSFAVYGILIFTLMAVLLFLTSWLGENKTSPEKSRPYESGIIPTHTARLRYPISFFLVAIFFLLFDIEGAFIFTWAVANRSLGWEGWLQLTVFIVILLFGLTYIWHKGGLHWGTRTHKK